MGPGEAEGPWALGLDGCGLGQQPLRSLEAWSHDTVTLPRVGQLPDSLVALLVTGVG